MSLFRVPVPTLSLPVSVGCALNDVVAVGKSGEIRGEIRGKSGTDYEIGNGPDLR